MGVLEIRTWDCGNKPVDDRGHYVQVIGREQGLQASLFHLLGLETGVRLGITLERFEFSRTTLTGHRSITVPLESIASTWHGYEKPWRLASVLAACGTLLGWLPDWSASLAGFGLPQGQPVVGALFTAVGLLAATAVFRSGRCLTLGFADSNGQRMSIRFHRTQLKGMTIGDEEARRTCKVVQRLIEAKQRLRRSTG